MIVNIRGVRLDLKDVSSYYPHFYEDGNKNKTYSLYYYVKGVRDEKTIRMSSEEEMDAIIGFIDKELGVVKLTFTPEKEVTKAKLEISR